MDNFKRLQIYVLWIALAAIMFNGCKKDDSSDTNPTDTNPTANSLSTAVFNPALTYGSMTDQDGNTYKTIKIGTQTWMAENLRTTKYRTGEAIPEATDNYAWMKLTTGAQCTYSKTSDNVEIATFGRFYNWYTVSDSRNITPAGWHVPTDDEWTTLITFLGGESIAGSKMKETGTKHWISPNSGATNESGFTALPYGWRSGYFGGSSFDGATGNIGSDGVFWSSTQDGASKAWSRHIERNPANCFRYNMDKQCGLSIRCVKD
jgi:uncharacterized protein (TIGR02145 family)